MSIEASTARTLAAIGQRLQRDVEPALERSGRVPLFIKRHLNKLDVDLQGMLVGIQDADRGLRELAHSGPLRSELQATAAAVQHWRAIPDHRDQWRQLMGVRTPVQRAAALGRALETLPDPARLRAWVATSMPDSNGLRRAVVALDPELDARIGPWLPGTFRNTSVADERIRLAPVLDDAQGAVEAWWQTVRMVAKDRVTHVTDVDQLRLAFRAATEAHARELTRMHPQLDRVPATMPEWLARLPSGAPAQLTRTEVFELYLRGVGFHPREAEHVIATHLLSEQRMSVIPGFDYGRELVVASRLLPEGVRPVIPPGIEDDADAALLWARATQERTSRAVVRDADPSTPFATIHAVLAQRDVQAMRGAQRVALELLDAVPVGSAGMEQVRRQLRAQLTANVEGWANTGWHPSFDEHGRALATAQLAKQLEQTAVVPTGAVPW